MSESPVSLQVTVSKQRLDEAAQWDNITSDELAQRAIESYLDAQEAERLILEERIAEAEKGVFISGEAMLRWVKSWGTENELPRPEPDVFLQPKR